MSTLFHAALIFAGASTGPAGDPPSAPPFDGSTELYSTPSKVRVKWRNGDATAYTRIYQLIAAEYVLQSTVNPGVTAWDSGKVATGAYEWQLRHYKNGQESAGLDVAYPAF